MKRVVSAIVGLALTVGCATPPPASTWTPTGDPLTDGQAAIEHGPKRDRVLWEYRAAAAAMRRGQFGDARRLLDDSLAALQGIYGPNKEAKRSRSYFASEAKKTFLGEPYERVMAYYYRGVLYWMDGELDNARACFRSAEFMDSDAENREYACDYVLLDYLDGLATLKLGGDGQDAYQRAETVARLAKPPGYDGAANVLFFIELGNGPVKYATGQYAEELRFSPGSSRAGRVRITCGAGPVVAEPFDDLTFQATTRGGRVMDHVLANKAVFKQATDTAGNVALIGGAIMASQHGTHSATDEVGAGLMVAGLVSKIISAATTPTADTRSWDNLPQYLSFAALRVPPGEVAATVEFLDAQGSPIPDLAKTIPVHVLDGGRDTVVFVSDRQQ